MSLHKGVLDQVLHDRFSSLGIQETVRKHRFNDFVIRWDR